MFAASATLHRSLLVPRCHKNLSTTITSSSSSSSTTTTTEFPPQRTFQKRTNQKRSKPGSYQETTLEILHEQSNHVPMKLFSSVVEFGLAREVFSNDGFENFECDEDDDDVRQSASSSLSSRRESKTDDEKKINKMIVILPESEEVVVNVMSVLGKPNEDPHWSDVWHGGVALCEFVRANEDKVRGKRVLELGSGVGITGVYCAMLGAKVVTMTDREPFACYCSVASAVANGFDFNSTAKRLDYNVRFVDGLEQLEIDRAKMFAMNNTENDDGDNDQNMQKRTISSVSVPETAHECERVEAKILDWFKLDEYLKENVNEEEDGTDDVFAYDVVIACDCLYCEEAVDAVASIVFEAFSRRNGDGKTPFTFLLADPPSRFPQNHAKFLKIMQEKSGSDNTVLRKDTLLACRNPFQADEGEMVVKICEYTIRRI